MNRIYFVRHGENLANLTHQFSCRRVDYSLTPKGVLQAEQTAAFFAALPIDAVFASPLKRARETAEIIAAPHQLPVTVYEEFLEVNVGALEDGDSTDEDWALHNDIVASWFKGDHQRSFPAGENYFSLLARQRAGLRKMIAGREHQNLIIVGHGGMWTFTTPDMFPGISVAAVFASPSRNCSITTFDIDPQAEEITGQLIEWAHIAHLSDEAANFSRFKNEVEPAPDTFK